MVQLASHSTFFSSSRRIASSFAFGLVLALSAIGTVCSALRGQVKSAETANLRAPDRHLRAQGGPAGHYLRQQNARHVRTRLGIYDHKRHAFALPLPKIINIAGEPLRGDITSVRGVVDTRTTVSRNYSRFRPCGRIAGMSEVIAAFCATEGWHERANPPA